MKVYPAVWGGGGGVDGETENEKKQNMKIKNKRDHKIDGAAEREKEAVHSLEKILLVKNKNVGERKQKQRRDKRR